MNWKMISAVGQIFAAIGVTISLVYLASQIRSKKRESRQRGNERASNPLRRFNEIPD